MILLNENWSRFAVLVLVKMLTLLWNAKKVGNNIKRIGLKPNLSSWKLKCRVKENAIEKGRTSPIF